MIAQNFKKALKYQLTFCIYTILLLSLISGALGRPFRLDKLPDKGENFSCLTCHVVPGGPRNAFGKDYEEIGIQAGDNYTEQLGKMDSDGDGFTNDEEFAAGTNPGDPNSKPEAKIAAQTEQPTDIQPQNVISGQDKATEPGPESKVEAQKMQPDMGQTKSKAPEAVVKTETQEEQPAAQTENIKPAQEKVEAPEKTNETEPEPNILVSHEVYLYTAARFLAITGFILIFIQYVLSSKIRFIEKPVGLDKLFIVHRKVGVVGLILILLHPTLLFIYNGLHGYRLQFKAIGAIALSLLIIGAGAAILYARLHLKYETWKNIHRINYAILPVAFIHSIFIGSDLYGLSIIRMVWYGIACLYVMVMIYKIWNWLSVRRHPFRIANVVKETHDITSLHFDGKHRDYKPGQFMIINLVRNGKVSESHPFTISSSPTRDNLSISVKAVGDFTSTIGDTKTSDMAYIDAPYGRFSFLNHDAQNIVFIAGGIGITPFLSALRYMYDKKMDRHITVIWANKSENDIGFRDELEKMANEMPNLKIIHVMSKQDNWPGEKGYIDREKIKRLVSNIQESQFFICGPPIMMTLVEKELINLGVSKGKIHYERFALR